MSERSRNFAFTLNNYTQAEFDELFEVDCKYYVDGKENVSTPHLQGYISFPNARTLKALKKVNPRAHWEIARGTPAQNRAYCIKDGDFREKGVLPMDAKAKGECEKDRWAHIIKLAQAGDWDTLISEYPDVYGPKLKNLEYINKKRPRDLSTINGDLTHEWIVGETGCGKSRKAREENPGAYIKNPNVKWWDGYNGEEVVIIDDFDKYQVSQGGDMKRWLDRYAFQAEFKGGMEMVRPKKIVVTSQYYPQDIWGEDQKTVDAIMRRIKLIDFTPPPAVLPSFVPHPSH